MITRASFSPAAPMLATLVALAVFLVSCPGTSEDGDGKVPSDGVILPDGMQCRWPPNISKEYCDSPPNAFSKDLYYCHGCNCAGVTPTAACNRSIGDCRYFANGCYPTTYTPCTAGASDAVAAMCLACFILDAGSSWKERCDKLSKVDSGS